MELKKYDPLDYLVDEEAFRLALDAAIEEDPATALFLSKRSKTLSKLKELRLSLTLVI